MEQALATSGLEHRTQDLGADRQHALGGEHQTAGGPQLLGREELGEQRALGDLAQDERKLIVAGGVIGAAMGALQVVLLFGGF
ncbi:MAG: hypothetical protein QNK03_13975 [Myxococcota bacterium]|nr:hypothetical protein [Myxococcota bacterium]